jgi:hypothetical protein
MTDIFKAIGGFILLAAGLYVLWQVAYMVFFLVIAVVSVIVKWAIIGFMIFLAFAVVVGMIQALFKG